MNTQASASRLLSLYHYSQSAAPAASDFKCKVYRSGKVSLSDSAREKLRKVGLRELQRQGMGQHTLERALKGSVKTSTATKIMSVIKQSGFDTQ
jgi:hypothetical protein